MTRRIRIGGAQLGGISRSDSKKEIVDRLVALLRQAGEKGCELVVFPELALSTFFPRWYAERDGMDGYFEDGMPNAATLPLFEEARRLGIGFSLGYAELVREDGRLRRFNTTVLMERNGEIVGKYRKIHLPGHAEYEPERSHQHLEKRYFEVGDRKSVV